MYRIDGFDATLGRMRSIWTGSISFGLLSVPVKVYGSPQDHDISLHQVHNADGGRIRYQRRCEVCDEIVGYADIAKAYEDGGQTVILTEEDFASLQAEKSKEIEVVQFVPSEQIDPLLHDRAYYLASDAKSPKTYALLCQTLGSTSLVAVVTFALRQKTRLGLLSTRDDVLVLQSLLWPDELREPSFGPVHAKVSAQELEMSKSLLEAYRGEFAPEEFTDTYQVELRRLIDAKLEQGDAVDTAATRGQDEEASTGEVVDLMAALKSSLARKRAAKSDDSGDADPSTASASTQAQSASGEGTMSSHKKSAPKKTATIKRASGSSKSA